MRTIRIELLIATLALLASAAASIATVVQTRVVGNQLSASVWPYLSIEASLSPNDVRIQIVNDGLGPALIKSVHLSVDGRPETTWHGALARLLRGGAGGRRLRTTVHAAMDSSDVGPTSVVRAGESLEVLHVHSALANEVGRPNALRFRIATCYCSLLGQCWRLVEDAPEGPVPVADCGTDRSALVY